MARVLVDGEFVKVALTGGEKLEALHTNVPVPRSAIARVRVVPDGIAEVHGVRAPGTASPA